MKKLIFVFSLILSSCATGTFVVNVEMGMSETEFKQKNVGEQIVYMRNGITAYRMYSGTSAGYLYYYFNEGKLVEINQGERQPDIIIQNQ